MKKTELRKIIKEEIKSTLKEEDFASEINPSNKMIYDMVKEILIWAKGIKGSTSLQK